MGQTAAKRGALGGTLLVGFIQRQNGALTSKPVIDRSEITRDHCGSSGPPLLSAVLALVCTAFGPVVKTIQTRKATSAPGAAHLVYDRDRPFIGDVPTASARFPLLFHREGRGTIERAACPALATAPR
jgi:hypothetical protein